MFIANLISFVFLSLSGCSAAEPVRPIDPAAWISHTTAMTGAYPRYGMSPSMSITTSTSSSLTSSIPDSESKSQCGQRRAGGSCSGPAVPSCAQIRPQSHARWKRQRPHNSWMLSDVCDSVGEHKAFFSMSEVNAVVFRFRKRWLLVPFTVTRQASSFTPPDKCVSFLLLFEIFFDKFK